MKPSNIIGGLALIGIIASAVFFINSVNTSANELKIKAPLEGHGITFDEYRIQPDSGTIIERNTGTQLIITANSFTRKDGSKPSGEIALKVREMHDPYAIMRSGIPMEVSGTGGKYLQSAGMIEIRAYEGDNELIVKDGKTIGVELAAYKVAEDYNLYFLKEDRQWETRDNFSYRPNERRKNKLIALSKLPQPPIDTTTENEFVFVISGDTNYMPELKAFINQEWLLLEKDKLASAKKAVRQNWSGVSITPVKKRKMHYRITFSFDESIINQYGTDSIYSFLAKPIMRNDQSRNKNRKDFEQKMEAYASLLRQNEEEKERAKQQAAMVNAFRINQTGVWNIDKIIKEEVIITKVNFDFESEMKGPKTEHKIFMILEDNNSVIYVSRSEWDKIPFPANQRISIAAVLNGLQVAFIPSDIVQGSIRKGNFEMHLSSQRMSYHDFLQKKVNTGSVASR
jgi:hypothetical protein